MLTMLPGRLPSRQPRAARCIMKNVPLRLVLTVLDVYSRKILGQLLWWRIRKEQVKWLLSRIIEKHPVKGITLRNDNGSQFIAQLVRDYLKEMQVDQEFTHVATPEENAFIESYHSIVERSIERRYEFESIYDAGLVMNRWKKHYNENPGLYK